MPRLTALLIAALLSLFWQAPARASGDFACAPTWMLAHDDLSGCDNMALLGPGNDTRVNLVLLLRDLHDDPVEARRESAPATEPMFDWAMFKARLFPQPDAVADGTYAEGEGSRCRSNTSGIADFEAAIEGTRKLSADERTALIAARRGLQPDCLGPGAGKALVDETAGRMKSPTGVAFARYLQGAQAFYGGDYDTAAARFAALDAVDQPWLKETARYMLGRVEVNRAQIDAFDDYGYPRDPAQANGKVIAAAEAALRAYLKAWPDGLYALSARGLLRRVYWLGGQDDRLVAEYAALFAQAPAARGIDDATLAQEIDNKLLLRIKPEQVTDPVLLAVIDLMRMRRSGSDAGSSAMTLAELEAQRAVFARNPALFDYLLAAHAFFVAKTPADVLRIIPDAARQGAFTTLQFSRQTLRGMALEAVGDRNARGFWLEMLPGTKAAFQRPAIELALSLHDERGKALARVFEPASPVTSPAIRELLLANVAGAALLRQQAKDASAPAHEREVALFTLLYKDLTRGAYREFVADLELVPGDAQAETYLYDFPTSERPPLGLFTQTRTLGDYGCPALKETATRLASDPGNPGARLCLADFLRANGFDGFVLDSARPNDELGSTPSLFAGGPYSRLEVYKAIIADPKAPAPDKAYALHRAIACYAPSGSNSCGGVDVPVAQRRAWFQRLKKEYPASRWAQALRYFW